MAAAVLLLGASAAQAAVPRLINFQGRLADASGTPKTGSFSMTFSIWTASTAGTSCFSETQAVAANSGLFNVNIGSATTGGIAAACDFSVPYYLQLQVGTDSAMSPRIALTAAAYALRAEIADNAAKLGGYTLGSASGNIPRNEGTLMTNLNADMVDGKHWADAAATFAAAGHTHPLPALVCSTVSVACSYYVTVTCPSGYVAVSGAGTARNTSCSVTGFPANNQVSFECGYDCVGSALARCCNVQ